MISVCVVREREFNAPSNMVRALNISVDDRVTQSTVLVLIINLGSQTPPLAFLRTLTHLLELNQVLFNREVSVFRRDHRSTLLLDGFALSVVHESVALLDELLSVGLDFVEVVGSVNYLVEGDFNHFEVFLDSLFELTLYNQKKLNGQHHNSNKYTSERWTYLLLERVGVIETEDELALVLVCQVSVKDSSLEVTNVQVS